LRGLFLYQNRSLAFHSLPCTEWFRVSPFNRWPFIPHPQGHRPCFLDEAGCFVLFCLGRRLLPRPARTFLRNMQSGPAVSVGKLETLIIHVFPFQCGGGQSARLRYFCILICHFAFCTLIFYLLSYPLSAIPYPLYAIRYPPSAKIGNRHSTIFLSAIFNFNQKRTHSSLNMGKKQNFLQTPLPFIL